MFDYPLDVYTAQNTTQTLSVESHLTVAKTTDEQSPLKFYHEKFGLYKYTIIEKDKTPKAISTNINVKELEDIFRRTDYAFNKQMEFEYPTFTETKSPAYTVQFRAGNLKGKTPAEVLLENPANKEVLQNQYKYLKENLQKFPGNKAQMDAIMDAARLLKEGKLEKQTITTKQSIKLYPPARTIPKALVRKPREDGKCFVHEAEIYWHVGDNYPVEIKIKNYYASVEKDEGGRINPDRKTAEDIIEKTMRLSEADWMNHIRALKADMRSFEMMNAKQTRTDAANTFFENKKASEERKSNETKPA